MLYALREALRIVLEDGLKIRTAQHKQNAEALWSGLQAMGLDLHAQEGYRLPSLTTVQVPEMIDDVQIRQALLSEHNIEIGGGLGPLKGRVLRIGMMGSTSSPQNVLAVIHALQKQLAKHGYPMENGSGIAAASHILSSPCP